MAQQRVADIELKEKCSRDQFLQFLRNWVEALEGNHDMRVTVKGQNVTIPAEAPSKGRMEVEYEIEEGEYEFQLTMKWR